MKSLLDPTFKYVGSQHTDLRKTFARVRREMAEQKREREAQARSVVPIIQRRKQT
jgi:hypothetical protein